MVTHSMQQAVNLGDRIVMMYKGEVLHDLSGSEKQRARPEDLLQRFEDVRRREQLDATVAEMLRKNYILPPHPARGGEKVLGEVEAYQ
jgi:putative ABC transport system ATP-binding protein